MKYINKISILIIFITISISSCSDKVTWCECEPYISVDYLRSINSGEIKISKIAIECSEFIRDSPEDALIAWQKRTGCK